MDGGGGGGGDDGAGGRGLARYQPSLRYELLDVREYGTDDLSAALGGLFPDLFIRRWGDDVELSWTADPPPFAPEGLTFESRAGHVRLAVADVARPLWEALRWAAAESAEAPDTCREDRAAFRRAVKALGGLNVTAFERAYVPGEVLDSARTAFEEIERLDLFEHRWSTDMPFVEAFSPAVAMYGGVSPNLDPADVSALRDALIGGCPDQDEAGFVDLIERAFHEAGDDYIEQCEQCTETGRKPDKSFSGRPIMRMEPALHRMNTLVSGGRPRGP